VWRNRRHRNLAQPRALTFAPGRIHVWLVFHSPASLWAVSSAKAM
jgi:hypothetical protein